MSTKAERKRQEAQKKKIGFCVRIVCVRALLAAGFWYYYGDSEENPGDSFEVNKSERDPGYSYNDQNVKKDSSKSVDDIKSQEKNADNINMAQAYQNNSGTVYQESAQQGPDDTLVADPDNDGNAIQDAEVGNDNISNGPSVTSEGKININTASVSELCKLNGIGEKRANDIIEYRENHGGFKKIEDIMKVKGIKQGIFSKIKDEITC